MDCETLNVDLKSTQNLAKVLPDSPVGVDKSHSWTGLFFSEFYHPSHEIPEYVAPDHMIIVGGRQSLCQSNRIDGKIYKQHDWQINDNSLIVVPSGATNLSNWTNSASFFMMSLCPDFFREISQDVTKSYSYELTPHFGATDPFIYQTALPLREDMNSGFPMGKLFGESVSTMLVARLLQSYSNIRQKPKIVKGGLSQYSLRKVIAYIDFHISEELTLVELSAVAGLSCFHFLRLFKTSLNSTPHQYIMNRRIEHAKTLLRLKGIPLHSVALDCGFSDQSHFTNVFRKYTQVTPSKYRREVS